MEFALSEEQELLKESITRCLHDNCTLDHVRAVTKQGNTHTKDGDGAVDLWQSLASLGACGVLVPEEFGGAGLGYLEACLIGESLGQTVAPVPWLSTAVLAPVALNIAGSKEQKEAWLPAIAQGKATFGLAISEKAAGARQNAGVRLSNGRLSGTSLFALDCPKADALLVAAKHGDKDCLLLVQKGTQGLTIEAKSSLDATRPLYQLNFDSVEADRVGHSQELTEKALHAMIVMGRLSLAADTLGAASTMIKLAVDYAAQRTQFGRTIGSFQAVKHLCAEMAADIEPCHALVWYAAYALHAGLKDGELASLHAKAHLSAVGKDIARKSTEVHGGTGFTDLTGLHFWFKRIDFNRVMLGTPQRVHQDIAALQQWTAQTSRATSAAV